MMNMAQRTAVFEAAKARIAAIPDTQIEIDGGEAETFFDEVPDGVWVHCWLKVPAADIPGYVMEPPAPSSVVSVTHTNPE